MLDNELEFYRRNRAKLLSRYPDKTIVIKGTAVIGVYDSHDEAYTETRKEHEVGTFLIKSFSGKQTLSNGNN